MSDSELEALFKDMELDRVERKPSPSDPNSIRQAICAFANDLPGHGKPGVIFIGVNDDGTCKGLQVTDELLRKLADMRDDGNIQPIPSMTVEKKVLCGCELAVVIVQPSIAPPVRLRGRTWIRVGPPACNCHSRGRITACRAETGKRYTLRYQDIIFCNNTRS